MTVTAATATIVASTPVRTPPRGGQAATRLTMVRERTLAMAE